nr:transcriptional regulator superman [Quercus suber]
MEKPYLIKGEGKGKWDSNNFSFEEDHSCGVSWPAKQVFTCNFCKRQFRNNMNKKRIIGGVLGFEELRGTFAQKDELKVLKKEDTIKLGLEIGLLKDPQEDLDLELRLGFF